MAKREMSVSYIPNALPSDVRVIANVAAGVIPSNLTSWTKAMGRPRNKTQLQDEGDKIRREIIDWLTDKLTEPSCPLTTEQMNHLRMVTAYFPEGQETAEKIDRIFADKPAPRQAILLSTIVTCLDRLLA